MDEQEKQDISPWPWYAFSHDYRDCLDEWYTEFGVSSTVNKRGLCLMGGADSEEEMMANAAVMAAAPELRAALEDIVKNACRMCETELKVAMHGAKKPCEDGRECPRGMDDAKKAIAKSYWKKEQKTDEND